MDLSHGRSRAGHAGGQGPSQGCAKPSGSGRKTWKTFGELLTHPQWRHPGAHGRDTGPGAPTGSPRVRLGPHQEPAPVGLRLHHSSPGVPGAPPRSLRGRRKAMDGVTGDGMGWDGRCEDDEDEGGSFSRLSSWEGIGAARLQRAPGGSPRSLVVSQAVHPHRDPREPPSPDPLPLT